MYSLRDKHRLVAFVTSLTRAPTRTILYTVSLAYHLHSITSTHTNGSTTSSSRPGTLRRLLEPRTWVPPRAARISRIVSPPSLLHILPCCSWSSSPSERGFSVCPLVGRRPHSVDEHGSHSRREGEQTQRDTSYYELDDDPYGGDCEMGIQDCFCSEGTVSDEEHHWDLRG